MLFVRQKSDKLLILVLLAGLFAFLSYRPKFQINKQVPVEFLSSSEPEPRARTAAEERMAKAYWDCVVNNIQWKYNYGSRLPQDAPPEFIVIRSDLGANAADGETRARYWRKLQQVWYLPSTWKKEYVWDASWTTRWIETLKDFTRWLQSRLPR